MKAYGGVHIQIQIFLTSALLGGEWSASRPGRFTAGKEPPVPTGEEVGWTSEPAWTTWRKVLTLPGLELRPLDPPARSQSPYRLRYPGSLRQHVPPEKSASTYATTSTANSRSTIHYSTHLKSPQPAVFTSFLVTASKGGRSLSSGFPSCSCASVTSFSQQQLTRTAPQQSSNSPTNPLHSTNPNCPAYNITARTAQKTPFLSCCSIVAYQTTQKSPFLCCLRTAT
jgi:hypothetical protein